jgi:hypothetical protein
MRCPASGRDSRKHTVEAQKSLQFNEFETISDALRRSAKMLEKEGMVPPR